MSSHVHNKSYVFQACVSTSDALGRLGYVNSIHCSSSDVSLTKDSFLYVQFWTYKGDVSAIFRNTYLLQMTVQAPNTKKNCLM